MLVDLCIAPKGSRISTFSVKKGGDFPRLPTTKPLRSPTRSRILSVENKEDWRVDAGG